MIVEAELSAAGAVQKALLGPIPPSTAGILWHAVTEPAGKVGGDYYDFIQLHDGGTCVVLADVSGKGIPAAVFLSNVRAVLHAVVHETSEPASILQRLSDTLIADASSGLYVTCLVLVVDPAGRRMKYSNAGHPPGLAWSRGGAVELVAGGPPAGLLPGVDYAQETVTLNSGDLVVLVSDGVTEALGLEDHLVDALSTAIARAPALTPVAVCQQLLDAAREGPGPAGVEEWTDDRTVVAFGLPLTSG
jgi:sigma-B regulation protein RsbU (phosphoserine phosphatase)